MIRSRIEVGHSNNIGSYLAEELNVPHASQGDRQGIDWCRIRWRLVGDASNKEFGAISLVEEMRSLKAVREVTQDIFRAHFDDYRIDARSDQSCEKNHSTQK